MTASGDEIAAGMAGRGRLRASHTDREQVVGTLKTAFVQGRLPRDEFDARVDQAYASRTYAELADLGLNLVLDGLQPRELFHPPGQPFEVRDDQRAHRGIALRCGDPGVAVHLIGHRDRNILHSLTVTQLMWPTSWFTSAEPASS